MYNCKMESAKIIVFDLDQTLTESKMPLDEEMSGLLSRLLKKKKVAIISGAGFFQFENQFLKYLHSDLALLPNLYLLPTSGAALYEYKDKWTCVYRNNLTDIDKKKIFDAFEVTFLETGFKKEPTIYGVLIEDRDSAITFSGLGSLAPFEIKSKWDPDHAKRDILVASLRKKLPGFSVKIGGTSSIDVTGIGIDKAYGVMELINRLGYNKNDIFYIGDALFPGGNDSSIIPLGIGYDWVKAGVKDTKKFLRDFLSKNI